MTINFTLTNKYDERNKRALMLALVKSLFPTEWQGVEVVDIEKSSELPGAPLQLVFHLKDGRVFIGFSVGVELKNLYYEVERFLRKTNYSNYLWLKCMEV